jgi:hypothetical protein
MFVGAGRALGVHQAIKHSRPNEPGPRGCLVDAGAHPTRSRTCLADTGTHPAHSRACLADTGTHRTHSRVCLVDPGAHPTRSRVCLVDTGAHPTHSPAYLVDTGTHPIHSRAACLADTGTHPTRSRTVSRTPAPIQFIRARVSWIRARNEFIRACVSLNPGHTHPTHSRVCLVDTGTPHPTHSHPHPFRFDHAPVEPDKAIAQCRPSVSLQIECDVFNAQRMIPRRAGTERRPRSGAKEQQPYGDQIFGPAACRGCAQARRAASGRKNAARDPAVPRGAPSYPLFIGAGRIL